MDLLATAIAALAAVIAFGQFWTARQKLVLDLFEKRFAVFMDVRRVVSEATQLGKLRDDNLPNEIIARGRFLFGKDIVDGLEKLHGMSVDLETKEPRAAQELSKQFKDILPMFESYLSMPQRSPKYWS